MPPRRAKPRTDVHRFRGRVVLEEAARSGTRRESRSGSAIIGGASGRARLRAVRDFADPIASVWNGLRSSR